MGIPTKLLQNLSQTRTKRMVLLLGMFACAILVFHNFAFPSANLSPPTLPTIMIKRFMEKSFQGNASPDQKVGKFSLPVNSENASLGFLEGVVHKSSSGDNEGESMHDGGTSLVDEVSADDSDTDDGETDPDTEVSLNVGNGVVLKKVRDPVSDFLALVTVNDTESNHLVEKVEETSESTNLSATLRADSYTVSGSLIPRNAHGDLHPSITSLLSSDLRQPTQMRDADLSLAAPDKPTNNTYLNNGLPNSPVMNSTTSIIMNSTSSAHPLLKKKKKKRRAMPTLSISEMNNLLLKIRATFRTMRPRRSLARDREILAIRSLIDNPPIVESDKDLYEPAFRNVSMFKRSYELMEQTLKVYAYGEGARPIFHKPLLKGIYASEGWFMKLIEGNKHFIVKDPRKAHLFYLPFSSRLLEFSLYVPNSHNRTNLRAFLGNYVNKIAAKYPFWNRTGGTDHFLVACHDWAPFETKNVMEHPIRALCNADLSDGFKLGKDVSLPETYVRFGRDPLRDIGGKPALDRHIFAFYAGNMHGYLRPILLDYWENKDPDMKIIGPMPRGIRSKLSYIQYMKNSKYCICPRGHEVNSPRVVEAIFYECVPVIISDNYVPPFFEVLNWEAFSVFVAEADIPKLKDILLSISEEKYLSLQMGVKKVQRHFIWHRKAVKYDLFHMILHSIWYNRVYTIKPR